jgi:glycosyltransferase involved in cell wall biosynthesis
MFFRLLVPRATSVRLVSGHLESELGRYFGKKSEIFICPIPVRIPELLARIDRADSVGVVGRLHHERGTKQLLEILDSFACSPSKLKFQVIGDGPERIQFESLLLKHPNFDLKLLGSLSHSQVLSSYLNINLLLSCAPTEGYGLALREAILSGVPVVAKENLGTRKLRDLYPKMVFLFNSTNEAFELVSSKVNYLVDTETIENYRNIQADLDRNSLRALVSSWS